VGHCCGFTNIAEWYVQAESLQGDGSKTRQEIPQTAGWKAQGGFCCIFSQLQLRPLVCMASPPPLFLVASQKVVDMAGDPSGSTSTCPWLRSEETLPAYWPMCKFDLILSVLFFVAFSVLTSIAAGHLTLCQCIAIAFRIAVLSVSFVVPSVVQCYFAHWLTILLITQPVRILQCGVVFHSAWNLWGNPSVEYWLK